jgi:SAM-dependent methyltransferase
VAIEERIALMAPSRRLRLALAAEATELHFRDLPIRVLDAGCGDGLLSLALARKHPAWAVTGVDLREPFLNSARARAADRSLRNVRFERRDLTEPLEAHQYDAVLALECLTEIPDDTSALKTMVDALRPGGLFVAQVPEAGWKPILRGSEPIWRDEVRHGYTSTDLLDSLQRAGLERVQIASTFRGTAALAQEVRDRIKHRRLGVRALAFPFFATASLFDRRGLTWGPGHALFATAWKPADTTEHLSGVEAPYGR